MDARKEKLRQRLEAARQDLWAVVEGLGETEASEETINPGWAIRDIVAHLAAAERGHHVVIRQLLAGESTDQPGFDLDAFNQEEVAARRGRSLSELLDELTASRVATMALLESIGSDGWDRAGRHPGGFDTTVESTFRVIAIHERRHLKDIRAALAG